MSKPKPDIVARLRDWASTICTVNSHVPPSSKAQMAKDAADEIERLRAELAAAINARDEARRDACAFEAIVRWNEAHPKGSKSPAELFRIARQIAADRGWDCFGEKEGGGA